MTEVEWGIAAVLLFQFIQIVYLSAIWNRVVDLERKLSPDY